MTTSGYTRQSAAGIITGGTMLASLFNAEYNQLSSAFDASSGHTHDGTVGGGQAIPSAGLSGLTSTSAGLIIANGTNGQTVRTLTGTSGKITVTNGTGVSGNPTLTIDSTYVGQNTITTLGTITTGVWNGTTIAVANGGTGDTTLTAHSMLIGNGTGAILGLAPSTSGNIAISNGTDWTSAAQTNITSLGTIGTGVWQGTIVGPTYGGTGVNNGSSTITIGGNHTLSGSFASTFTFTGITSVTFPTSGTLVNSAVTSLSSLATVGTITSGVWNGTTIAVANGGTGATTANAGFNALSPMTTSGDIVYGGASGAGTRLAANATATNKYLQSVSSGTPAWAQVSDADLSTTDITTNNVSTTKHGFAPKAPNDATKYLDGTGAYSRPTPQYKTGLFTRDVTTASGTQAVTGVGFTPKLVQFRAIFSVGGNTASMSWGEDDGVTPQCVTNFTGTFAPTIDSSNSIDVINSGGNASTAKITAFGADGFTVTWVKTGSPTGTLTIYYTAQG